MKKSSHTSTYSILILAVIILLGVYSYGIWKIGDYQTKTDMLESDIQMNTVLAQKIDMKSIENKTFEESKELAELDSYFIKEGQEFILIQKIEGLCYSTGVICNIQPLGIESNPTLPAQFHLLHLIIKANGTFKNVYQFASVVENLPYKLDVSKVELKLTDKSWDGNFDISVTTMP